MYLCIWHVFVFHASIAQAAAAGKAVGAAEDCDRLSQGTIHEKTEKMISSLDYLISTLHGVYDLHDLMRETLQHATQECPHQQ